MWLGSPVSFWRSFGRHKNEFRGHQGPTRGGVARPERRSVFWWRRGLLFQRSTTMLRCPAGPAALRTGWLYCLRNITKRGHHHCHHVPFHGAVPRRAVLESPATRTVLLDAPKRSGHRLRGAAGRFWLVWHHQFRHSAISHTRTEEETPGYVSNVYVRIRYRQAEPPYQATQARPRVTFHTERKTPKLGARPRVR